MNTRLLTMFMLLSGVGSLARAVDDIEWDHRVTQGAVILTANALGAASRTSFYTARGFSEAAIRPYAQGCGLSFSMQNGGTKILTTRLADWYAEGGDGRKIALRLPEAWDAEWERSGVSRAARIAFRWAQFQAENVFEPGDWIMGMATLEAVPSSPVRLVARYRDDKENYEIVLDRLACASD